MNFAFQDNLSVQVAKWLAEKIIQTDYAAGSRIMEEKIATELGISRGPIREALLILQKQRLVTILPRRGALVKELTATEIKDLYEVIAALYTLLGTNVATQWQNDQLTPLANQLKLMQEHAKGKDYSAYFQQTIEFIRLSYPIAKNRLLAEMIEDLIPSIYRVQYKSIQQRKINLKDHCKNYAEILSAAQERNTHKIATVILNFSQQQQQHALASIE